MRIVVKNGVIFATHRDGQDLTGKYPGMEIYAMSDSAVQQMKADLDVEDIIGLDMPPGQELDEGVIDLEAVVEALLDANVITKGQIQAAKASIKNRRG